MKSNRKQSGFSLLELLFVLLILTLVMGVVFRQINTVQKASRTEEQKLDLTQEGREFTDEFIRDVRQSGYPTASMYASGTLGSPAANDNRLAVGLVKYAYDEIWLEGDVNGDGAVESIDYKLQSASGSGSGQCPCKVSRSEVPKANGVAPMSQTISYNMELNDVINSGGANGSTSGTAGYTIYGTATFTTGGSQSLNTLYTNYKNQNLFTAYDMSGAPVAPADYSTAAGRTTLATIRTIRINLNLLARTGDLQTGTRAVIPLTAAARVGNN